MVIQHHAEEARDQDLERKGGASQNKDRKIVAAWNPEICRHGIPPEVDLDHRPSSRGRSGAMLTEIP
jgi:hypothetical protein